MKTMWDKATYNSKIHIVRDDGTLLCTGHKPAYPLTWEEFSSIEDMLQRPGNFHCKRCIAIFNKETE